MGIDLEKGISRRGFFGLSTSVLAALLLGLVPKRGWGRKDPDRFG